MVSATGDAVWVSDSVRVISDPRGGIEVVGVMMDVSEEKRLEDERRQSQKMEAVGLLAGGIAHDFNNLLGVITGYAELVQRSLEPGHRAHSRVSEILKAAERAAGLTRQLLAFSRRQVVQPKVLDLKDVVHALEPMLKRILGEDVRLVTWFAPDDVIVNADPGQIEQIVMNLAINARDAMPRGGRLTVHTARARLDEAFVRSHPGARAGAYALLEVSDEGTGMDPATLARIFEPFFTTKEVGRGTGLGLATVYGIVKQNDGYIEVESAPGAGSTFKVYLPEAEGSAPEAVADAVAGSGRRRRRGGNDPAAGGRGRPARDRAGDPGGGGLPHPGGAQRRRRGRPRLAASDLDRRRPLRRGDAGRERAAGRRPHPRHPSADPDPLHVRLSRPGPARTAPWAPTTS